MQARKRAEKLASLGLGVVDAAHLVFSEAVEAAFITCDDKLYKKCRTLDLTIWTGNPVAFCDKEGLR
jgi:predicted nucleic acid-binding protein